MKNKKYIIDEDHFINVTTKEAAYILGLWWADGYIYEDAVIIECVEEDLITLLPVFEKFGTWGVYKRNRIGRKTQMTIRIENKILTNYLQSKGYQSFSSKSACDILETIPDHLKHYWFRGFSDGDGCFYFNKGKSLFQFSFSSNYNQDWTFIKNLFHKLSPKIKFNESRKSRVNKLGIINSDSRIRIWGKPSLAILGNYFYKEFLKDKIGLERKYIKFQTAIEESPKRERKKTLMNN